MFIGKVVAYFAGLIGLLCLTVLPRPLTATAQGPAPIDVFLLHDRNSQQVRVSFTNAVTGLSSVATVANFAQDRNVLEEFKLTANGVIFRDPNTGLPRLITPTGNIVAVNFIPQRVDGLLGVDWVISEDGRTIAWAELYFENTVWQANLYVSRLDGTNYRVLPTLPPKPAFDTTRVAMVAVSNDGSRVFFDMEHSTAPRPASQYFVSYERLWVYVEAQQSYRPLLPPNSSNCPCPVRVLENGNRLIELEPPILGNGFTVRLWNLQDNRLVTVPAVDAIYNQGGEVLANSVGGEVRRIIYTLGGLEGSDSEETSDFALVIVNVLEGRQEVLTVPAGQRLVAMRFTNRDSEAIIVDTLGNTTYKLNLETGVLDLVANQIWLGSLAG